MSSPTTDAAFEITFDPSKENVLGVGINGAVYKGSFRNTSVAVKRIPREDFIEAEVKVKGDAILVELDHQNIIKVLHTEIQGDKR